jgi:hypothetical protein
MRRRAQIWESFANAKPQVIGDMWESYLRMLDDGIGDG